MAKTKPSEQQRNRGPIDAELQLHLDTKTEGSLATFQRYVRASLLMTLRREEASKRHQREIKNGLRLDGVSANIAERCLAHKIGRV